jgi:hypothetical protein
VVEEETVPLLEDVDVRVEREVGVNTKATETGGDVTAKSDLGDRYKETATTALGTVVGRGVELMDGRRGVVERGKKLNIRKLAGEKVLESFGESKNGTYTTSAISCSREGS